MAGEIYHVWNGTTLTVTSDSGTSSADLGGPTGPRGAQGPAGISLGSGSGSSFVDVDDKSITYENDKLTIVYGGGMTKNPAVTAVEWTGAVVINAAFNVDTEAPDNALQDIYDTPEDYMEDGYGVLVIDGTEYETDSISMEVGKDEIAFEFAEKACPVGMIYYTPSTGEMVFEARSIATGTEVITRFHVALSGTIEYETINPNVVPVKTPLKISGTRITIDEGEIAQMIEDEDIDIRSYIETVIEEYLAANYPNLGV